MVLALLIEGFFMGAYMKFKFLHVNGIINPNLKISTSDGETAQITNVITGKVIDTVSLDFANQATLTYVASDSTVYSWQENQEKTYKINGNIYRPGPSGYAMYLNARNQWRLSAKMTNSDLEKYS